MKRFLISLFLSCLLSNVALAQEAETIFISTTVSKRAIKSDVVVYNLSNAKLHTHDCEWALKCTKNCIFLNKNCYSFTFC